jgi:glycosyltransferase involved in cell wall biosynthesis
VRYSVLLPTRNGGKFLRACIVSILSQDYDDFELVISDNANSDETPTIIDDYRDHPRVRAIRLEEAVPVTDNWNAAYAESSGDYLLMMGDDDYLLPGYFGRMDALLGRHAWPDCVLYNGYSFVAPNSIAGDQRSYYSPHHFAFGPGFDKERQLSPEEQLGIVKHMFRWTSRIPLNMQTTLVARRAAERIEGGFYQAPFPDHYALNAMLVMGCRWVFTPERLVVVGVSPKSFGHYVYSGKQASGLAYLGIETNFPGQLPGNPLINGMHVWLNRLLEQFPRELAGVEVDRAGYVRRQVYSWLVQKRYGAFSWRDLMSNFGLLPASDWARAGQTLFDGESWRRLGLMLSRKTGAAKAQWKLLRPLEGIDDIAEFSRWLVDQPTSSPIASNTESNRRMNSPLE